MNWKKLMCAERIRQVPYKLNTNDLRTEFEKDYHRIVASASFRRLQDKTQVFPLDQSDFIRTRLTHSLEVSSFAKSLGQSIGNAIIQEKIDSDFNLQTKMDICDVLQCAGLLHDIGNPPFGHFGESAIQDWFKENLSKYEFMGTPICEMLNEQMVQDFYHFEGNTQAIRVVTKLHFLVDENGMNLTKALLGTIMKYPGSSIQIAYDKKDPNRDIKRKKMGYFYADRAIFEDIQSSNGTHGRRHPLAFILEAADDIAYGTADIEDAVKKGMLTYSKLKLELESVLDAMRIEEFMRSGDALFLKQIEMIECLIERLQYLYDKAVDKNYENPELYAIQNWTVTLQGKLLLAATESFVSHYDEIMDGEYKKELLDDTAVSQVLNAIKDIAFRYAFVSKPILKLEVAADSIFNYLLSRFVHAFIYYDTPYAKEKMTEVDTRMILLISENYERIYRVYSEGRDETEKLYLRLILITDYISGMTDSYAKRLYQELSGIS